MDTTTLKVYKLANKVEWVHPSRFENTIPRSFLSFALTPRSIHRILIPDICWFSIARYDVPQPLIRTKPRNRRLAKFDLWYTLLEADRHGKLTRVDSGEFKVLADHWQSGQGCTPCKPHV